MEIAKIGEWAFLAGVILALLVGLFQAEAATGAVAAILVALGIIVGFLNIAEKETTAYLVATIALLVAGSTGFAVLPLVGDTVAAMLKNIVLFVAPAAVIVALKTVVTLGKKK